MSTLTMKVMTMNDRMYCWLAMDFVSFHRRNITLKIVAVVDHVDQYFPYNNHDVIEYNDEHDNVSMSVSVSMNDDIDTNDSYV